MNERLEALLSGARLRIQIMGLEQDVNQVLQEVGELLYATHTGTPTESATLQAKLEEIDALKAEIKALKEQSGAAQAAPACSICGAEVKRNDMFCRECGGKL